MLRDIEFYSVMYLNLTHPTQGAALRYIGILGWDLRADLIQMQGLVEGSGAIEALSLITEDY